jgi:hypothetical protein
MVQAGNSGQKSQSKLPYYKAFSATKVVLLASYTGNIMPRGWLESVGLVPFVACNCKFVRYCCVVVAVAIVIAIIIIIIIIVVVLLLARSNQGG